MKTPAVINVRQAQDLRGSPGAKDLVYVGRGRLGRVGDSFGNPSIVGKTCPECGETHDRPEATLPCYEAYLRRRLATDPAFKERVRSLAGKVLVCHCKPGPCHGDVLASVCVELCLEAGSKKQA